MNVGYALQFLVGDYGRFGHLADRVEGLVEVQVKGFHQGKSQWLVLPWIGGFYLFSEDGEGQRRGREVLTAFLGPAVATIESVPDEVLAEKLPPQWYATGLVQASYLRRKCDPDEMFARLEDLVATMRGRTSAFMEVQPSFGDLLRDLRLAMLRKDDETARRLLEEISGNGHLSSENLRFLKIEYLATFGRWVEMKELPHINALIQARRPRVVTESLLQMIWWTELAGQGALSPPEAFVERDVASTFGSLLRAIRVPSTKYGRAVAVLTAAADGDAERRDEILERTQDTDEASFLLALTKPVDSVTSESAGVVEDEAAGVTTPGRIVGAFESGQYRVVVERFLDDPDPKSADLAVQAVLESYAAEEGGAVLAWVRHWVAAGAVDVNRRLRRDIQDLERMLDGTCAGWPGWAERLAGNDRWADASSVLRDRVESWTALHELPAQEIATVADSILASVGGTNEDQLRSSLDVLCRTAAIGLSNPSVNDFCQVVLAVLSDQENFSEVVRSAYLDLFSALLEAGPAADQYREVILQASKVWQRIASPNAADWAIGAVEASIDAPCPDPGKRTVFGVQVIEGLRQFYTRLGVRQRVEVETLAPSFGLVRDDVDSAAEELSVWSKCDGSLIGLYSLLPRAAVALESRLTQLCRPREVRGNGDTVSTPALRTLAERADFLIVDTWHAAHQATGAIDSVRPKNRQILPRQKGISGFLRALEEALA
ncbi:hypothetical protein Rruber_01409 [Rhodococcus ruber]|uniref:protein DpdD n=1 Tax=Rhodococcus ruber TaxID=1830 RepID=UPI00315D4D41